MLWEHAKNTRFRVSVPPSALKPIKQNIIMYDTCINIQIHSHSLINLLTFLKLLLPFVGALNSASGRACFPVALVRPCPSRPALLYHRKEGFPVLAVVSFFSNYQPYLSCLHSVLS